jgi:hypothetical protein
LILHLDKPYLRGADPLAGVLEPEADDDDDESESEPQSPEL